VIRLRKDRWSAIRAVLDDGQLDIKETRDFPVAAPDAEESTETTEETLFDWLESQGSPRVYMLLQAGLTISRVLELSTDDGEDLAFSLRLQAESHLLGGSSAHRICMAPLPMRKTGINQGLVITWPESSAIDLPILSEDPSCISETTALLAMLPEQELESPILHADRTTGSLAVVLEDQGQLAVRSTREHDSDSERWRKSVIHAVVETAVTHHKQTDEVEKIKDVIQDAIKGREEILLLPDSVKASLSQRVRGAGDDLWWQEWGMSVGALLATEGPLQMLTTLSPRKPVESGGSFGEITNALSKPLTAAAILVGAFCVIALLPLITAWLRLSIIETKIDDQSRLESILKTATQQEALYSEIASKSWPMTKVLGDLANCLPLGIDADQITINEGDAIILRGSAGSYGGLNPKELITEMTIRLDKAGIFGPWDLSEDQINSGGKVDFSISLPVLQPFKYIREFREDYGETTHGQIRYAEAYAKLAALEAAKNPAEDAGEEVQEQQSSTDTPAVDQERATMVVQETTSPGANASSSTNGRGSTRQIAAANNEESQTPPGVGREALTGVRGGSSGSRRSSDNSSSSRSGSIRNSSGSAVRRSDSSGAVSSSGGVAPVPEAFTDTELATLSNPEAKELLERVARAKLRDDLDEETKQRLRTDLYRILDHIKSIPSEGGS
jgi:hypothetical protein